MNKRLEMTKKEYEHLDSNVDKHIFKKLEDGIVSGRYDVYVKDENQLLGIIHIKPIKVNPFLTEYESILYANQKIYRAYMRSGETIITKATYNFLRENYVDKNIDFIAYEVILEKDGEKC